MILSPNHEVITFAKLAVFGNLMGWDDIEIDTASDINDNKLQVSQVLSWKLRTPSSGRGTLDKSNWCRSNRLWGCGSVGSNVGWGVALYTGNGI